MKKKKLLRARYMALLNSSGRGEEYETAGLALLSVLNPALAEQVQKELGL